MDRWVNKWMARRMDGWMVRWVNKWMARRMDGWMGE